MISKELLSDVLGANTIEMNPIYERNNMVGYLVHGPQETPSQVHQNHRQINIHELAHKCKEWAHLKGFMVQSYPYNDIYRADLLKSIDVDEVFKRNTEPEAIFAACQWVLDNKETK